MHTIMCKSIPKKAVSTSFKQQNSNASHKNLSICIHCISKVISYDQSYIYLTITQVCLKSCCFKICKISNVLILNGVITAYNTKSRSLQQMLEIACNLGRFFNTINVCRCACISYCSHIIKQRVIKRQIFEDTFHGFLLLG